MEDWTNVHVTEYTHVTQDHVVIKNDLTDVYEHKKMLRVSESKIVEGSTLSLPSSIKLDQVHCYILIGSSIFPILRSSVSNVLFMFTW